MLTNLFLLLTLPLALSYPGGGGGDQRDHDNHPNPPGSPHHPTCPTCKPCPTPNTCLTTSLSDFTWSLSLEYHAFWYFTTPAHQNSWGTVTLNLTNPAIPDVTVECQANSDRLSDFFYGDQLYSCLVSDAAKAKGVGETGFRFWSHSKVEVNQTWGCDKYGFSSLRVGFKNEGLTRNRVKFNAIGNAGLEGMKCTDVSWTNPNWTMGSGAFYSTRDVKCTPISLKVKPVDERILL